MIIVSVSSGIDSTFCILLISKIGYKNLLCTYIKIWNYDCKFKIHFKYLNNLINIFLFKKLILDCEKPYSKIFKKFLKLYKIGKTPNADIVCNNLIKFRIQKYLYKYVIFSKFIFLTGHYLKYKNGFFLSDDFSKDQSYFLYKIIKIKNCFFPLGNYYKYQIKKILDFFFLLPELKSSKGMCFIEKKNFQYFLKNYIGNVKANVYLKGEVIGKKSFFLTTGQKIFIKKFLYIFKKNRKKKSLYVCDFLSPILFSIKVKIENKISLYNIRILSFKLRNNSCLNKCILYYKNNLITVIFLYPQIVSIEQSLVFYYKKKLIFGSKIKKIFCKNFINY
ncbi:hypothetical protein [Candidatus Vidania fulgoroideorum]